MSKRSEGLAFGSDFRSLVCERVEQRKEKERGKKFGLGMKEE